MPHAESGPPDIARHRRAAPRAAPGGGHAQANIDESILVRQEAIICSMTPKERRNPKLINASRKRRIAGGSGSTVQEINRVLKQWKQMSIMMKKVKKLGNKGLMRAGLPGILPRMP